MIINFHKERAARAVVKSVPVHMADKMVAMNMKAIACQLDLIGQYFQETGRDYIGNAILNTSHNLDNLANTQEGGW